eukprot:2357968-Alexandrium_andersonii.AAC.1
MRELPGDATQSHDSANSPRWNPTEAGRQDSHPPTTSLHFRPDGDPAEPASNSANTDTIGSVSYTHLRAHETSAHL